MMTRLSINHGLERLLICASLIFHGPESGSTKSKSIDITPADWLVNSRVMVPIVLVTGTLSAQFGQGNRV